MSVDLLIQSHKEGLHEQIFSEATILKIPKM